MFQGEDLFVKLFTILRERFDRDPSQYTFILGRKDFMENDYSCLDVFLTTQRVSHRKTGIDLSSQSLFAVGTFMESMKGRQPFGFYLIYADTDEEIIFYFYEDIDNETLDGPRCITGYRNEEALTRFLREYRAFMVLKERENSSIKVYRGKSIEIPALKWEDLILPLAMKEDIRWNIERFKAGESTYRRLGVPFKRGFLFVGPPGNGKTMLLKMIAANSPGWKFIYFVPPNNCSNVDINLVFREARDLAPSMLCLEDLDSLFLGDVTLSHFLNKLDGFEEMKGTLILATTNHPERIDTALTSRPSRFDRVWVIDNPDRECRQLFIERNLTYLKDSEFIAKLAASTEGFSMAYLKELHISASMLAIDRGLDLPGEEEVVEVFQSLARQVGDAKTDFAFNVKRIGFGAG